MLSQKQLLKEFKFIYFENEGDGLRISDIKLLYGQVLVRLAMMLQHYPNSCVREKINFRFFKWNNEQRFRNESRT